MRVELPVSFFGYMLAAITEIFWNNFFLIWTPRIPCPLLWSLQLKNTAINKQTNKSWNIKQSNKQTRHLAFNKKSNQQTNQLPHTHTLINHSQSSL